MIHTLIALFAALACFFGVFTLAAGVEAALLRLFPGTFPNVSDDDKG